MLWLWIVIGIVAFVLLIAIFYFNRFVVLERRVENSLAQIDVQLKKRADLIPNLIETVKGYARHERRIMEEVARARQAMLKASDIAEKVKASNQLEKALGKLFAIAENYPQLKANENFLQLQQELSAIEDKIAYARQYYNDSIMAYNILCTKFPGVIFAKLYGKKEKAFLKIPEVERKVPKVSFE